MIYSFGTKRAVRAVALIALGIGAGLATGAVHAAEEESPAELRKLCADDYKKHCAGTLPGGGRIRDCMMANMDKLSAECRAGVEEWKKKKDAGKN